MNVLLYVFALILFGFGGLFGGGYVYASESLEILAQVNEHSGEGYNDVWGYTDPEGREYALLGVSNGLSIIDLATAPNFTEISFIPSDWSQWKDIKTYSHYAYVVNESGGGLQIVDLSDLPNSARVANVYEGFFTSHNLYIDEANALLYAEGNNSIPVRILSLEDPLNPVEVGGFGVECHDIYVRNNIAFVSEGGHGTIGIFDTSSVGDVSLVTRLEIPNSGYVHNAWLSDDGRTMMTTEENTDKTVKLWDISDLNNITRQGEYLGPGNLAHNTHIKGDFAYISHYGGGLRIVNISDPFQPMEVAHYMQRETPRAGFYDSWGAYPFFSSGKILMSDIEDGLFVFQFDAAKGAE